MKIAIGRLVHGLRRCTGGKLSRLNPLEGHSDLLNTVFDVVLGHFNKLQRVGIEPFANAARLVGMCRWVGLKDMTVPLNELMAIEV